MKIHPDLFGDPTGVRLSSLAALSGELMEWARPVDPSSGKAVLGYFGWFWRKRPVREGKTTEGIGTVATISHISRQRYVGAVVDGD